MVTVNFTKAVALTHELRAQLYKTKTRELFQTLQEHHLLMEYMEEGADKDAMVASAANIHAQILVCNQSDTTYQTNIDAVTTDDLNALEAIYIQMEEELKQY